MTGTDQPPVDPAGTLELFDVQPLRVDPPPPDPLHDTRPEGLSADRWRTRRQRAAIEAGLHPLTLATGIHIPLHPDAARSGDPADPGLRCGTCAYRQVLRWHDSRYPKCTYVDPGSGSKRRWSHGPGTDVRAFWGACQAHLTAREDAT